MPAPPEKNGQLKVTLAKLEAEKVKAKAEKFEAEAENVKAEAENVEVKAENVEAIAEMEVTGADEASASRSSVGLPRCYTVELVNMRRLGGRN